MTPRHLVTQGTPSPPGSRLTGDPALTRVRRSVRVGAPFVSLPCSLPGTHRREPSRVVVYNSLGTVSSRACCCDGRRFPPLETGVQPMQASPLSCGQDLRNCSPSILSGHSAFPAIGWTHSAFVCCQTRFLCASLRTGRTPFEVSGSPAISRNASGVTTRPLAPCLAHTAGRAPPNDLLPFAM